MSTDLSSAVLASWSISFWPTLVLLLTSLVYVRGWLRAKTTRPFELPAWRAFSFHLGLAIAWLAICSPLDSLGEFLLTAHMTQHLLLMSVVPPLLWLGAPVVPMLRGLPRFWMRDVVAVWIDFAPFKAIAGLIAHPLFGWLAMNVAYAVWHIPAMYELALRSNEWHYVEHACFLLGSLAYWFHVIAPWPRKHAASRWLVVPYIFSADVVNTIISASLAFSSKVVYPTYATVPRLFEISAIEDQVAAGAEMWVISSLISLVPLLHAVLELLASGNRRVERPGAGVPLMRVQLEKKFNLLRTPVLGAYLSSRYGRLLLQACSFLLMSVIVLHGLRGTELSSLNFAGSTVWMVARPLLFLLMLFCANLFCMACPFTFLRELARLVIKPHRQWPAWLRNKWIALLLTMLFFWFYLQFDLWNWPSATALLLIAYAASALVIDLFFAGASFCKYVCPVGQFNFITSLVAPLAVGIQKAEVCANCTGKECINGRMQQRGCELQLFLPQKIGNMDCTLCMDCVKACTHNNVQIALQPPLDGLLQDAHLSSVGRLSQRRDLALLAALFTLYSLWNAAAMTAPVLQWMNEVKQIAPVLRAPALSFIAFVLLSLLLVLLAAVWQGFWLRMMHSSAVLKALCRTAFAFLPLGLSAWLAHLLFHLVTASSNFLPAIDQFLRDFGIRLPAVFVSNAAGANAGADAMALCAPGMVMLARGGGGTNLLSVQVWLLDAGLLAALYLLWRIADAASIRPRLAVWMSSATLAVALYGLGLWIFIQPMLMPGGGGQ